MDTSSIDLTSTALPGQSQSDDLLELARAADVFITPAEQPFATVPVRSHRETWPIESKKFKQWLQTVYYQRTGGAASGSAVNDAIATLTAYATHASRTQDVYLRLASFADTVHVDLCDESRHIVTITASGWDLDPSCSLPFMRSPNMESLPVPHRAGSLDALRDFVNVHDDAAFRVLVAWMVSVYACAGSVALLEIIGEEGSAKSTLVRLIRKLVDPNQKALRSLSANEYDLAIAGQFSRVLAFDNVSHLSADQSDALCRVITGGSVGRRQLWTDQDEVVIAVHRPVVLTGVNMVAMRDDLRSRTATLELPPLRKARPEDRYWKDFETVRPAILGALFDAVAGMLRERPRVDADGDFGRMADFAVCARALERALGWEVGGIERTMRESQHAAGDLVHGTSLLVRAIEQLVVNGLWQGTASELLEQVRRHLPTEHHRQLPQTPRKLSEELRRAAAYLRKARGISVSWKKSGERMITLERAVGEEDERQL